jgi:hypothetical protein
MKADTLELNLYRNRLISSTARPRAIQSACKTVIRLAGKYERAAMAELNGVPDTWDAARKEWTMRLTEADQERLTSTIEKARVDIETALRSILIRGLEYDFRRDARYTLLRIRTKDNRRAMDVF